MVDCGGRRTPCYTTLTMSTEPKLFWYQFGLRSLLLLTLFVAVLCLIGVCTHWLISVAIGMIVVVGGFAGRIVAGIHAAAIQHIPAKRGLCVGLCECRLVLAMLVYIDEKPLTRAFGRDCMKADEIALVVAAIVLFDNLGCKRPRESVFFVSRCRVIIAFTGSAAA